MLLSESIECGRRWLWRPRCIHLRSVRRPSCPCPRGHRPRRILDSSTPLHGHAGPSRTLQTSARIVANVKINILACPFPNRGFSHSPSGHPLSSNRGICFWLSRPPLVGVCILLRPVPRPHLFAPWRPRWFASHRPHLCGPPPRLLGVHTGLAMGTGLASFRLFRRHLFGRSSVGGLGRSRVFCFLRGAHPLNLLPRRPARRELSLVAWSAVHGPSGLVSLGGLVSSRWGLPAGRWLGVLDS